jgi:excisionase family DNA binding protein
MTQETLVPHTIKDGMSSDPDRILTAHQAAQLLRVHYRLVLREAEAGRLPGRRIGREWRFVEGQLLEWLKTQDPPHRRTTP